MSALIREVAEAMPVAEWVARARELFTPSARVACAVCGKYKSLTHAHHVIPLAMQSRVDRMVVNHEHEWLRPTHHAAVHVYIGAGASSRERASPSVVDIAADLPVDELRAVMALAERAFK